MKKIYAITAALIFIGFTAQAQFQFGAQGSYLKGTGGNTASLWGGGIHGKFYVGQHLAFGAAVRVYPKQTSKEMVSIGSTSYTVTNGDYLTNASGSVDILLSRKDDLLQWFIGADAGVSFNNHTVTYSNDSYQSAANNNKSFFLASPKVGVNIGLLPSFGVFGQAMYNLTFGNGKDLNSTTLPTSLNTKPVDKYFTFDAGVYFRLSPAKR